MVNYRFNYYVGWLHCYCNQYKDTNISIENQIVNRSGGQCNGLDYNLFIHRNGFKILLLLQKPNVRN